MLDSLFPLQPDASLTAYTTDAVSHAEEARQLARLRTFDSQERQRARYDQTHRFVIFSPSDLVLLCTPQRRIGLAEKLLPHYTRPYRIHHKVTDVTYVIEVIHPNGTGRNKQRKTVHIVRLKPFLT